MLALRFLLVLPIILAIAWGVTAYFAVNKLFGLSLIFVLNAALLAVYAIGQWRNSAWRITRADTKSKRPLPGVKYSSSHVLCMQYYSSLLC